MTERNMQKALEEAKRVVGLIEADALTEEQKEALRRFDDAMNGITSDSGDEKKKKKGFFSKLTE